MTVTTTKDINYLSISSEINNILKKKRKVSKYKIKTIFIFIAGFTTLLWYIKFIKFKLLFYLQLYHVNIFASLLLLFRVVQNKNNKK